MKAWDDIDVKRQIIHIHRASQYLPHKGIQIVPTKNSSSVRSLIVSPIVFEALTEYRIWWNSQKLLYGQAWQDEDNRVMVRENGAPIAPGSISSWLDVFTKKHGLQRITPHGLRHANVKATTQINYTFFNLRSTIISVGLTARNKLYIIDI